MGMQHLEGSGLKHWYFEMCYKRQTWVYNSQANISKEALGWLLACYPGNRWAPTNQLRLHSKKAMNCWQKIAKNHVPKTRTCKTLTFNLAHRLWSNYSWTLRFPSFCFHRAVRFHLLLISRGSACKSWDTSRQAGITAGLCWCSSILPAGDTLH